MPLINNCRLAIQPPHTLFFKLLSYFCISSDSNDKWNKVEQKVYAWADTPDTIKTFS